MKSPKLSILAYGCVAKAPAKAHAFESIKRFGYSVRDRLAFRLGRLDALDYRNHETSGTYNLGDHAIMLACLHAIGCVRPAASVLPVNWMQLTDEHASHDVIVICGSGYFFLDQHLRLPPRISEDLSFAEKHDLPIIVFGAGFNFTDATLSCRNISLPLDQQLLLKRFLNRCTHIGVRDEFSQGLLQSCTDKSVQVIGDPALFSKSTCADVSLPYPREDLIGINLPFHGAVVNRQLIAGLPAWIETFRQIQLESGCRFRYMVHYDAERVVAQVMRDAGLEMTIVEGGVNDLLLGYSSLRLHLGGMLHSCILAASQETPCLGLAYDIKHIGFFQCLGLDDLCFSTQPWPGELIVQKAVWALSVENELRQQIVDRRGFYEANAFAFLEDALSSLGHGD